MNDRCRIPIRIVSRAELVDLLTRAEKLGYSLEKGCALEKLTIRELEQLVRREERARYGSR